MRTQRNLERVSLAKKNSKQFASLVVVVLASSAGKAENYNAVGPVLSGQF